MRRLQARQGFGVRPASVFGDEKVNDFPLEFALIVDQVERDVQGVADAARVFYGFGGATAVG